MSEEVDFGLLVSFPDQSETFVLGFEAGMIWQRLDSGDCDFNAAVHTANLEVIRRMASAKGVEVTAKESGEWATIFVHKTQRPRLRVVSGGLSEDRLPSVTCIGDRSARWPR